jgi:hypothetical protein
VAESGHASACRADLRGFESLPRLLRIVPRKLGTILDTHRRSRDFAPIREDPLSSYRASVVVRRLADILPRLKSWGSKVSMERILEPLEGYQCSLLPHLCLR